MGVLIIPLFLFFQEGALNSAPQPAAEARRQEAALHSVPEVLGRGSPHPAAAFRMYNASVQQRMFVEKFNTLMYALMEFADVYKTRQTIDVRKAKAVREAW